MSKLNPTVSRGKKKTIETRLAGSTGAKAAKQGDIALLRRLVLANLLWENGAYVDGATTSSQIAALIPKCDPVDVATLAFEARKLQKLRHTPLFIAAHMLQHPAHKVLVPKLLNDVITRPDMMTDFLAIYQTVNGKTNLKSLSNAAKKGLASCFHKFDEHTLAKYDRDGAIKLRDVMFLTHPKPANPAEDVLFTKIANRNLDVPDTWEVAISKCTSLGEKKAEWERLLAEGKLGGLAFLRNLRNMFDAGVDAKLIKASFVTIKSGMLLPLNFINAAKNAPQFRSQISDMMVGNYADLPKLPGHTIFVVDVSGSMGSHISSKSVMSRIDAALAMAILAAESCESIEIWATAGSDSGQTHSTKRIDKPKRGFDLAEQVMREAPSLGGGGIFTRQCLEHIQANTKKKADRIIIFSDSQDCDHKNKIPAPFGKKNYIVDVSANKNGINYKGVWTAEISGFSEHFLSYIAAYEGIENNFEED